MAEEFDNTHTHKKFFRIYNMYRLQNAIGYKKILFVSLGILNKTPGYLRDIWRRPTILKMPFRRMKAFFFQNTLFLHHVF